MAWEVRNGQRYYYEKKRVKGRVTSVYVGSGDLAEQASEEQRKKRKQEKAKRAQNKQRRDKIKAVEQAIKEQETDINLIIDACLIMSGYHFTKNEWRKKRT